MKKIQQKFTPKEEGTMAMKQNYTDKAKLRLKQKKQTENHSNGGKQMAIKQSYSTKKINKQKITPMEERKVKRNR